MKTLKSFCSLTLICAVLFTLAACSSKPSGDAARGAHLYAQCAGCHSLTTNTIGPMHCGLLGRAAGGVPGFNYSESMKSSGLVWGVKTLDEFLTSPITYVPGTTMGFVGLHEPADRADLIAYLQQANSDPTQCPK